MTVNLSAPFAQNEVTSVLLQLERKSVKLFKAPRRLWAFGVQEEAFVNRIKHHNPSIAVGGDSADDLRITEDIWKLHPKILSWCAIA